MSERTTLLSQAEQLSEEGRLLLVLGRTLERVAAGVKDPLGPWILDELRALRRQNGRVEKTAPTKRSAPLKGGRPRQEGPVGNWYKPVGNWYNKLGLDEGRFLVLNRVVSTSV